MAAADPAKPTKEGAPILVAKIDPAICKATENAFKIVAIIHSSKKVREITCNNTCARLVDCHLGQLTDENRGSINGWVKIKAQIDEG